MDQIPEIIGKTIDVLTAKFGATGAHLWEILVKQAILTAYTNLILAILFLIILIGGMISLFKSFKLYKQAKKDDDWRLRNTAEGYQVAGIIVGIVGLVCVTLFSISAFNRFYNPEYYALQKLLPTTITQ